MNDSIKERINILHQMNTNIRWEHLKKKNQKIYLNLILVIYLLLLIFVLFGLYISVVSSLGIEPEYSRWNNSPVLMLTLFGLLGLSQSTLLEVIGKMHILRICTLTIDIPKNYNNELRELIKGFPPRKMNKMYLLFYILMVLGTMLADKHIALNPWWEYFDILSVIFICISLLYLWRNITSLRKNLKSVENIATLKIL